MSSDRWGRIEQLYHEALQRPASDRLQWLAKACDDKSLCSEVEALLSYDPAAERFLEGSALTVAAVALARSRPRIGAGRRLGGYEVLAFIGSGGMGEVYRARDVRLGREVALKIFENTASADAVRRFETEARATSLLNHPNIVTIYGVGEDGDTAYIAMELVHGRTLRMRLDESPCGFSEALDIAVQLSEAIAAAHAAGIVHRDLKPENVMISAERRVKVLDFGIAKLQDELWATSVGSALHGPTVTEAGALLGTVGYMSPEQALGRPAVQASDQFSFGVVCYEMFSGRRPFSRPTRRETLEAIVSEHPEAIASLTGRAAPVAALLDRVLAKNPLERYGSSTQLASELRDIADEWNGHERRKRVSRRQLLISGAMAAAAAATVVGSWRLWSRTATVRSLAVLPFGNPAADANTEYLCDGLTDTLIRQLAQLPTISVIARATAFTFKNMSIDPSMAGQRLGVDAALAGAVTRRGGRVLVSVELIQSATGARMWGADFDRPAGDVLAVQNELADAIIRDAIHLQLTDIQRDHFRHAQTDNAAANELFLQAIHHLRLDTEDDYLVARDFLLQAVALDQRFALALVTLASTYSVMAIDGYAAAADSWPHADLNVERALAIDPDLPDAHAEAAASAFFYRWDWPEAQRRWTIALQSRRSEVQSELLTMYALQQWALGKPEAALVAARTAREVDPLSAQAAVREGDLLAAVGRHDEAAATYERIIRDVPADPRARFGLAEVRRKQGRFADAISARREAHAALGDRSLDEVFVRAQGSAGYSEIVRAAARRQLDALFSRKANGDYVSPLDLSRMFAQLGRSTEAFEHMESAFEDRAAGLVLLKVDPAWDNIRGDPRFAKAIQRVGIP